MNSIKLIEIEQIYNFIAEYPGISSKNNFDRICTFISAYKSDLASKLELNNKHLLEIRYHDQIIQLDLNSAPNFLSKTDFIHWCSLNLLH